MNATVTTWADGFGNWRALVPAEAAAPLLAARRAILEELLARERKTGESEREARARLSAYVRSAVKRNPANDKTGYLAYIE